LYSLNDLNYFQNKNYGISVNAVPIDDDIIIENNNMTINKDTTEEKKDLDYEFQLSTKTYSNCSKIVVGYYTEWRYYALPPSKLPFDKLTHINYAFGRIDPNTFGITGFSSNILSDVANYAHKNNVKILLSIGGWSGSEFFTKMTSSIVNMKAFVQSVVETVNYYELDGIDIDWEYPGREGYNNNPDLANDTPNYLILLKKLRDALGDEKLITGAVSSTPFQQNGVVLNDLSEFAFYFNFINIMAYDFSGNWSYLTSHHESFDIPEKGHRFSFKNSIQNWVNKGFPPEKIVVGVGAYGRSWIVNSKINFGMFQTFNKNVIDRENDSNSLWKDYCHQTELIYSSTYRYKYIYKYILSMEDSRNVKADQESNSIIQYDCWLRVWDSTAQAPYLFNTKFNNVISYDDPQSLKEKSKYILENGFAGVMMWELDGDTEDWILINTMNDVLCQ
jgi:chitinase